MNRETLPTEVVRLTYPIQVDGREINEVTLRRPKVRDIQQINMSKNDDEFMQSVKLISNLTMLTTDQVLEMDMGSDFAALRDKVNGFLGIGV